MRAEFDSFIETRQFLSRGQIVLENRSDGPLAPTLGRSVDHIGWLVDDLDSAAAEMRSKGAEFHEDPHWIVGANDNRVKISYVTGPGGVNIEVLMLENRR